MKKVVLFVSFLFIASGLFAVEVYNEPFTTDISGVTTYSVTGDQVWCWVSYDDGCAKMTGYDGTQYANEDWLITPAIDLTGYTDSELDFREAINYESDVSTYETIWASTNYSGSGDPTGSTWTQLNVTGRSSGSSWTFVDVDTYDLSAYDGESTLYIGFKYLSTDSNAGTWEIGEIVVSATGSTPEIIVDPTSLGGFAYVVGNGPSGEKSFDASGTSLTADLSIAAPTNYEISETSGSGFGTSINLTPTGGTVSATSIYVRLKAGLAIGEYNAEDITASSTGATNQTVTCNGFVVGDTPNLMLSKIADPGDVYQARFVQLYNATGSAINFDSETWYICKQANGGTSWATLQLSGSLAAGGIFNIAYSATTFNTTWGFDPDQSSGSVINGNGDDGYYIYYNGDHTTGILVDAYGVIDVDGTGEPWEYKDSKAVRKAGTTEPSPMWLASQWDITSANTTQIDPSTTTLPVELSSFTADFVNEFVTIKWATASETDVHGFNIYRAHEDNLEDADKVNISLIPGHGTTTQPNEYSFTDLTADAYFTTYYYWLEVVNYGGTTDIYGSIQYDPVDIDGDGQLITIIRSTLDDVFPNPVQVGESITFNFMIGGLEGTMRPVSLNIYNVKGELVKEVINEEKMVNKYKKIWRVNDMANGVYFYQLKTENYQETKKLLIQ